MDDGNFVESVSRWETSEACWTGKARINKGEERETERKREGERERETGAGRYACTDRQKNRST